MMMVLLVMAMLTQLLEQGLRCTRGAVAVIAKDQLDSGDDDSGEKITMILLNIEKNHDNDERASYHCLLCHHLHCHHLCIGVFMCIVH